eukprot:CAMPEP_0178440382 /NCGR_PEP_ID=MMETSP0689_2-20121128/36752_1 /TAXON_ID=160604 /ORGANISM="Amphidinium massartii, Strain CS-259" /LENGTH=52 /DNA_ID=CAMNT_0020063159 /DNA_START=126 /DNA_END=284 /DNA_ORIENTATION=-
MPPTTELRLQSCRLEPAAGADPFWPGLLVVMSDDWQSTPRTGLRYERDGGDG